MAINDRSMEEFQAVHNMILEVLRNEKVNPVVLHPSLQRATLRLHALCTPTELLAARLHGSPGASCAVWLIAAGAGQL